MVRDIAEQWINYDQRRLSGTTEGSNIDKEAFQQYFSNPAQGFGKLLYEYVNRQSQSKYSDAADTTDGSTRVRKEDFVITAKSLLSLSHSKSDQIKFYCNLYSKGEDKLTEEDSRQLIEAAYVMYMASMGFRCEVTETTHAAIVANFATKLSSCKDMNAISYCIQCNCPDLLTGMHDWVVLLLNAEANPDSLQPIEEERLPGSMLSYPLAWLISCSVPATYTVESTMKSAMDKTNNLRWDHWMTLYDSNTKGLSMNRFQHHTLSYKGPTIMLVTCSGGYLFVIAVDQEWRESTQHWGGSGCAILQFAPTFKSLEEGANMMFLNDRSRSLPKGIMVGKNNNSPVLTIDGGLTEVTHTHGMKSGLESIEVIGCGGSDAIACQTKQKEWELRQAHRQRKVPLPGNWDENPDKFLLELGGIKVNHAEQVRDNY
ncbi:uncharacterized protein [Ptychodera flava]|uniref:uncharacterized protein isoform X1 n=1 Tax=Ptychodera flava TaxID=63121 RepID=UPI00396A518A